MIDDLILIAEAVFVVWTAWNIIVLRMDLNDMKKKDQAP